MKYFRVRLVLTVQARQRSTWILVRATDSPEALTRIQVDRCVYLGGNFLVAPQDPEEITQQEYEQTIQRLLSG